MKTILFLSSIFFLLGLKISNMIDLRGKTNAVDKIIVNKIMNSKPVTALPLFKDAEQETDTKKDQIQAEPIQKENNTPVTSESDQ